MKILYFLFLLSISSISYSQSFCPGLDSLNYGGQWYHTVQIDSQCWFKENLNIGTMIPAVADQPNDSLIQKYCYNNDPSMCDIYGGLYQWREAMQYTMKEDARGICPIGWHIPSITEYFNLIYKFNRNGNAFKKVGQGGGTNTSGFSALLGGADYYTTFNELGVRVNLWSSDAFPDYYAHNNLIGNSVVILSDTNISLLPIDFAQYGLSIRCMKDYNGLSLQSPYGGENWRVGSTYKITWGGTDLANKKIRLDYSTNNGASWLQMINSTPAVDGEYNWLIPNTPSKNCRVKITDINTPDTISRSDTVFTIFNDPCPSGSIVEHGGKIYHTVAVGSRCWFKENVNLGTMIPGSQQATANGIIEKYCYNDDTNNCNIYGGLYSWSETGEPGFCPTYWHAGGIDDLLHNSLYDGNALKAVGQGSGFGAGSNTTGFSVLLAGYRGKGIFDGLGSTVYLPSSGTFNGYTVTEILFDSNDNIDETDLMSQKVGSSYRCYRDEVGSLVLKSPIGGESWLVGSTQNITWTLTNVVNIKIDYTTDNGTDWINIIPSTPTSTGSYNWVIPNTPSTNCKVKISSVSSSDTNSVSNVFQIYQVPTTPCPGIPTIVYGGQTYNTISIGDQCWLRENLNIGIMIDSHQNQTNNTIIEKYCYNNDTTICEEYGGLYQWDEAMQYDTMAGAKGICPNGWHIPKWGDFTTLESSVGNNGNDLKSIGEGIGLGVGTNASGFSALFAGLRVSDGSFNNLGYYTDFWSSRRYYYDTTMSYLIQLDNTESTIGQGSTSNVNGFSIRCLNDLKVSELPVELNKFTALIIDYNIKLNWNTATEINASSFEVEKRLTTSNAWQNIASIKASGNSNSPKQYSYLDKNVNSGKYSYRLKMVDLDGSFKYSNIVNVEIASPAKFELANAYPNPWNPTTTIHYQVPVNVLVTIKVFDAIGKEVSTLVNEVKPAGSYEVTFSGKNLSSGIYYYQMKAGNFVETKKIIMIK